MSANLDHSVSAIVANLLIDLGVAERGPSADWSVFAGSSPDSPDKIITVHDAPGTKDGRSMIDGEILSHPQVEIVIRDPVHAAGSARASMVAVALDAVARRTVRVFDLVDDTGTGTTSTSTDYLIHAVSRLADPVHEGQDIPRSTFHLFSFNAKLALEKS